MEAEGKLSYKCPKSGLSGGHLVALFDAVYGEREGLDFSDAHSQLRETPFYRDTVDKTYSHVKGHIGACVSC
jgi:hypothetical protein